jgi:hypothetical protein
MTKRVSYAAASAAAGFVWLLAMAAVGAQDSSLLTRAISASCPQTRPRDRLSK